MTVSAPSPHSSNTAGGSSFSNQTSRISWSRQTFEKIKKTFIREKAVHAKGIYIKKLLFLSVLSTRLLLLQLLYYVVFKRLNDPVALSEETNVSLFL